MTASIHKYRADTARENNHIGLRIARARRASGMSLTKFRLKLEGFGVSVSNAAINKWENGGSAPNAYQLLAISHALGLGTDLSWCVAREGQELNEDGLKKLSDYREDLILSGRYAPAVPAPIIHLIQMPVSRIPVSAGTGTFLEEEHFELLSFPREDVPKGADFGLRVSGDSMEPKYQDGQIVWVQQCDSVPTGAVGVFIYNGEGYLKVYGQEEGRPAMISCNPAYPPKSISPWDQFRVVGRVL